MKRFKIRSQESLHARKEKIYFMRKEKDVDDLIRSHFKIKDNGAAVVFKRNLIGKVSH
jgi:hypothetical protein